MDAAVSMVSGSATCTWQLVVNDGSNTRTRIKKIAMCGISDVLIKGVVV